MNAIKYALIGLAGIIGVAISIFGIRVPFAESLAKEHWRGGLVALLLIILSIPAAIALFLYLADANRFKGEIVQYVKVHSQRDLVLQGDLKVTFFPRLGLDSGKMSLSQRNSAREFASVNNARLYIAWWPLFKKQLVFEGVEFDGIHANLTRFKDGTTNFDDLLIRNETLSPVTFDISGMRITNSAINWQDEMKWQRVALQDVQIETGRLADTIPSQLSASFHLNSEMIHSDSSIELKSRFFYDRNAGRYEFADIDGKMAGTVAGFSNLDLTFKGSLDSRPAQELLLVENMVVSGTGNYGQRNIEAKLNIPKLQFAKGVLSGSQTTLDATLSQFDEKWSAAMQMPGFEIANRTFKTESCSADFNFKGEGRTLQGKLSSPVLFDFETTPKLQLGAIALNFSATHPMLSDGLSATATGSLKADIAEGNANLDFKAKIDDSEISGKLAVNDFNRPAYTFELNTNRLEPDRYISPSWIKRYQDDAMQIDLSGIKNLTLSGRLNADEFNVAKFKSTKLAAVIKVEQSTLTIAPLTARLYGGTLAGSISVVVQDTPQIALKQSLRGIQMNALLADTASAGRLAGKGDITLDLGAEGSSIGALRKTLNGSASLVLAHGSLAGINLRAALLEGKDDLGTKSEARVREAKFGERTDFSALKAMFNIKDGSSHGNSLDMRSPLFNIAGEGDLALDTVSVNYPLVVTVAAALKRQAVGDLADMRGVTVPVRVNGILSAPTMTLDFAAASGGIVARRIAAKLATEQAASAAKPAAPIKKRVTKAGSKKTATK